MAAMFDSLRNLGNMADLMRKAGEMQARFRSLQEELGRKTVEADAGAGAVTATVNGKLELVKVRIDRQKIDASDTELVEDLVVAAVAAAQAKAQLLIKDEMARMAQEMGLPPGMSLPGLGG
jgi:DNA-binding YbaB/EbfC family protein